MSLIESISRGALGLRADVSGTPAPWDDYWYNPLGSASASGMRITAESAKRVATVLACVSLIARNIGMMPCKIYTEAPDGSKKLVDHHPLYDVLYSRPNIHQTAFEWKQMMEGHLELRGNAYSEIIPGPRGPVDQLLPMHPDRVHVERLKPSGKLRYVYLDPLTSQTRNLMEEEVFHLRNFSDDGLVGQSTIGMACDTFGVALAQQDYSARFLKNDARPPIAIEGTNFKTKPDEDRFRQSWQESQTGANRGKAAILPLGVSIKELGVKPIDQQLLEARKFSRSEICSIFGVYPHMIGEIEKAATFASVEQFNILHATQCLLPRVVLWEQAIQRDLLTSPKYFAKFSMAMLLRGDAAARATFYNNAISGGWMCPDEARALEEMNPVPNGMGRRFWRLSTWAPLDQTATPANAAGGAANTANEDKDADGSPNVDDAAAGKESGDDASAAVQRERLKVLVTSAADRCVRKEVAALRRMVERDANEYQLEEFYAEHVEFVAAVLGLDAEGLAPVKQEYFYRSSDVAGYVAAADKGRAYDYIDRLAATESLKLASLAIGGTK